MFRLAIGHGAKTRFFCRKYGKPTARPITSGATIHSSLCTFRATTHFSSFFFRSSDFKPKATDNGSSSNGAQAQERCTYKGRQAVARTLAKEKILSWRSRSCAGSCSDHKQAVSCTRKSHQEVACPKASSTMGTTKSVIEATPSILGSLVTNIRSLNERSFSPRRPISDRQTLSRLRRQKGISICSTCSQFMAPAVKRRSARLALVVGSLNSGPPQVIRPIFTNEA